jgi:hypothetical protein
MIPSGYKEDVVYSQIPTSGAGDLSFTRASNGTRINSAGLVEVCPWNLLQYSEDFTNAYWSKDVGATVDSNVATAPNGTTTADRLNFSGSGQAVYTIQSFSGANTFSVYLKGEGANIGKQIYLEVGVTATVTLTGEWQRFEVNADNASSVAIKRNSSGQASAVLAWGIQVNGGTLKPYFPTTDRLNVPRLTYQNGGGGCPSLLLEKQSTNLIKYSEQFDNTSGWTVSNGAVSANQTTSPDGTQNADLFNSTSQVNCAINNNPTPPSITAGVAYTFSLFIKNNTFATGEYIAFNTTDNVTSELTARINPFDKTITNLSSNGSPAWSSLSSSVVDFGNGWSRYIITATAANNSGAAVTYLTATSAKNCYIWGFQCEASSYPTSYIPTTSSSATRVADACFKTGISSLIGQTEGVIFADFNFIPHNNQVVIAIEDWAASSKVINIGSPSNTAITAQVFSGGNVFVGTFSSAVIGQRYKCALAYKASDFAFYVNGTQVATQSTGSVPACVNFNLGRFDASQSSDNSYNQAALFKTRLTNAELASLTTI